MPIIVEDGSLVSGANSYVSEADLTAYAAARGIIIAGSEDELLIQAMDYIESLDYKGDKWTFDQALSWPRVNVVIDGWVQNVEDIPQQLKDGQMETALAIDAGNGPLIDLPRSTSRERVGEIEVEYTPGTSSTVVVRKINYKLRKILANGGVIVVSKA